MACLVKCVNTRSPISYRLSNGLCFQAVTEDPAQVTSQTGIKIRKVFDREHFLMNIVNLHKPSISQLVSDCLLRSGHSVKYQGCSPSGNYDERFTTRSSKRDEIHLFLPRPSFVCETNLQRIIFNIDNAHVFFLTSRL